MEKIAQFTFNGSNWVVERILWFDMRVSKYWKIRHITGRGNEDKALPDKLKGKEAVINVKNKGDDCFRYALLSVLHYNDVDRKSCDRASQYREWLHEHN